MASEEESLALMAKASTRHSLFKGVTLYRPTNRWRAQISHGGRTITLGDYTAEDEAARVFDRAAICKHGPAARTNFPVEEYREQWEALAATSILELLQTLKEERQRHKVAARHGRAPPHAHAGGSNAAAAAAAGSGAAARSGPSGPVGRQPRNRTPPAPAAAATGSGTSAVHAAPARMPQATSKDTPQPLQPPVQPARPPPQPRSPVPARAAEAAPAAKATAPGGATSHAAATATAAALSPKDQDAPPAREPIHPPCAVKQEPTDGCRQSASSAPQQRQQQQQPSGEHPQAELAMALPAQQQAQGAQKAEPCEDTCYVQADRVSGGGDGDDSEGTTVVHGSPAARLPFAAADSWPSPARAAHWLAEPGAVGPAAQQEEPQRPAGPSATTQAPPEGAGAMDVDEQAAPCHGGAYPSPKRTKVPEAATSGVHGADGTRVSSSRVVVEVRRGSGGGSPTKALTSSIAHRIQKDGVSATPFDAAPYGPAVTWRVQQRQHQQHDREQEEDALPRPHQQHQQRRDTWAAGGGQQAPARLHVQPLRGPAAVVQLPLPVTGRKRTVAEGDDGNATDQQLAAGAAPARATRPQLRELTRLAPPAPHSPRPAHRPEPWAPLPEPKRGCRWEEEEAYGGASTETALQLERRQQQQRQQDGAAAYSARAAPNATTGAQQGARQSPVLGMRAAGQSPRAGPQRAQHPPLVLTAVGGNGCWGAGAGAGMGRRLSSSGIEALQRLPGCGSLPASATAAAATAVRAASSNPSDTLLDAMCLRPDYQPQRCQAAAVAANDGRLALDQVDVLALLRGATRTHTQQQQLRQQQQQQQEEEEERVQYDRLEADRGRQRQLQHSVGAAGPDPQRCTVARPSARSLLLQLLALQQLEEEEEAELAAAAAAARSRRALQPLSEAGPAGSSLLSASVAASSLCAMGDARGGGSDGGRLQDLTPTGPTGDGGAAVLLQAAAERQLALSRQGSPRPGQIGASFRPPAAAQAQVLVQDLPALAPCDSRLGVVGGGFSSRYHNGRAARHGREVDAMDVRAGLDAGSNEKGLGGRALLPGMLDDEMEDAWAQGGRRGGGSGATDGMAVGDGQHTAWRPPAHGPDGTAHWEEYEGGLLLRDQPRARVPPGWGGLADRMGSGGGGGCGRAEGGPAAGAWRCLGGVGEEHGGGREVGSSKQPVGGGGGVLQPPPARLADAVVDVRQAARDRQLPGQVPPAGLADSRRQQGVQVVCRDTPGVVLGRAGSGVGGRDPRAGAHAGAAAGQHQLQLQHVPRVAARIDGGEGCGRIIVDVPPGVAMQLLGLLAGHRQR